MYQNIYNPNTDKSEYTHNGINTSGGVNPSQNMWGTPNQTLSWESTFPRGWLLHASPGDRTQRLSPGQPFKDTFSVLSNHPINQGGRVVRCPTPRFDAESPVRVGVLT